MRLRGLMHGFSPWCDIWSRSGWLVQRHVDGARARVLPPLDDRPIHGGEDECLDLATRHAPSAGRERAVVLLHGILNDRCIMVPLADALNNAGWAVANVGYASTHLSVEAHARAASAAARALSDDGARQVDFVGHSLGGLVARAAMARAPSDGWTPGGLVLIGSPARGSAIASLLCRLPLYETLLGAGGFAVTRQGATAIPRSFGTRVAVIAGGNGGRGFNPFLSGDNDATVTVAETRMQDSEDVFLLVRARHNPLVVHRATCAATLSFLQTGRLSA